MATCQSAAVVRRFVEARETRNRLKDERDACFCERAEPSLQPGYAMVMDPDDDMPRDTPPSQPEPCWKAARKRTPVTPYSDGGKFYLDPPMSEWCQTCQRRQVASDAYRKSVTAHAGALRGLIRHGKSIISATREAE